MNSTRTPAHRLLVRHLLSLGATISVDGETPSTNRRDIVADIEACGMAQITVLLDGKREWAQLITGHGMAPEETVADFSCDGEIDAWFERQSF